MRRRRRELLQLAVVVRAAQAEKAKQVQQAVERAAPLPGKRIEYDEFGDPVRGGYVVGFWERAGIYEDTA